MNRELKIQNATIEKAEITAENGFLDVSIRLDYGGTFQHFGGWTLYLPKSYKNHQLQSTAGHFIWRVLEVAGVTRWEDLKGKNVRVRGNWSSIDAIGHITKDDWFAPREDFKDVP